MFKKITITSICILIIVCFVMPFSAFAGTEEDLYIVDLSDEEVEDLKNQFFGSTSTINIAQWALGVDNSLSETYGFSVQYYVPLYNGVLYDKYTIFECNGAYRLVYYTQDTVFAADNTEHRALVNGTIVVISDRSLDNIKNYLFDQELDRLEVSAQTYTETAADGYYKWLGAMYAAYYQFNSESHFDTYYAWYSAKTGETPPLIEIDPPEEEENDDGILASIKELIDTLKEYMGGRVTLSGGAIVFNHAGNLINEKLAENKFYGSITQIKYLIEDLVNEDYSDRNGFYELGLTKITLGRPEQKIYYNYGNDIIGDFEQWQTVNTSLIDWGLKDVQILDFDWYFGKDLGNGYYTKGVKDYSDKIVSGFLWLVFAWYLWHNLPDLLMGEIGSLADLSGRAIENYEINEERIRINNEREARAAERQAQRQAEKEHRKSYSYYKENRARSEAYSARYYQEKREAKKK